MSRERDVRVGKRKIHTIGAEHWAVKIGNTWHEIQGRTAGEKGDKNLVVQHKDDAVYEKIQYAGSTKMTDEELTKFIKEWLESHPRYGVHKDNCQLFVRDLVYYLCGVEITTQNNQIGSATMILGGALAGIAGMLIVAGSLMKNH